MTDNTEENQSHEDRIEARGREIRRLEGGSLLDAMLRAESELMPKVSRMVPESFTVTIPVKPRVAHWVQQTFGTHETWTLEERLGAYLETVLTRARVKTMRDNEPAPEVVKGSAVSLRREHMDAQKG